MAVAAQPIVGRDAELAARERTLDAVRAGEGTRVVEISGEAGIGKTRLLDALCARVDRGDGLVLRGQAAEFERNVPFAPIVDALDAYLATLDPGRLKLPEGELRTELGGIFPSLSTAGPPPGGVHEER